MSDPFLANVVSLLNFEGMPDGNTVTDYVPARSWTAQGGFAISSGIALFDGIDSALRGDIDSAFADLFASGTNWTIEGKVQVRSITEQAPWLDWRPGTDQQGMAVRQPNANEDVAQFSAGDSTIGWDVDIGPSANLTDDTDYEFAVTRSGNDYFFHIDGQLVGQDSSGVVLDLNTNQFFLGKRQGTPVFAELWMYRFRMTSGVSRYDATNYTVEDGNSYATVDILITTQPTDTLVSEYGVGSFTVVSEAALPQSYQWYKDGVAIPNATSPTYEFVGLLENHLSTYFVRITTDTATIDSDTVTLGVVNIQAAREALVWNFEDDTFTWMDAAQDTVDTETSQRILRSVVCMQYQPDPGWEVWWSDLQSDGTTWQDLQDAGTKWSDFYSGPAEENLYWLTQDGVLLADQNIVTDGLKQYFIRREQMDLNDLVQQWTTDKWIYANQFYFHAQTNDELTGPSYITARIGWSDTMMDEPGYKEPDLLNVQSRNNDGDVKWDFRSTGRYLALQFNFNASRDYWMTGGEINAEQSYGR